MTPAEVNALAAELRARIREECRTVPEALAVLELVAAGTLAVALTDGNDRRDVERWAGGVLRRVRRIRAAVGAAPRLQ